MVVVRDDLATAERYAMDFQEVAQGPRVFGHEHICPGQDVERAERDVTRSADRGRHEV